MKAYKGFNADMTCRGFKYEEGKVYYEAEASLCEKGFHACVNPIDCFTHYPPSSSIYHEVEIDEVDTSRDIDSKICGKKIKIGTRLTLAKIIKLSVDFILSKTDRNAGITNTRNQSAATNTGDWSAAEVSGKESIAMVTGLESKARGSLGCWIVLTERGEHDGETFPIKTVRAYKVDGKKVLADTWYTLKNGRLTKVQ